MSTLTIYEIDTGKRTKLVRKIPASACKKEELDAMWHDTSAGAPAKCKEFFFKNYAHLIGADAVAGTKNLLVLLRGPRLGELAVIDAKTLAERKVIKLPWCDASSGSTSGLAEVPSSLVPAAQADQAARPSPKPARKKAGKPSSNDAADDSRRRRAVAPATSPLSGGAVAGARATMRRRLAQRRQRDRGWRAARRRSLGRGRGRSGCRTRRART